MSGLPQDNPGEETRCGYVALVGRPNVGKSTLMNHILGQKLSIVTAKPQTTRQRIAGIKTTDQGQVIYVDTPGIHLSASKALNRYMNRVAEASLRDVDLVLFLIEAGRWTKADAFVAKVLKNSNAPVLLVLNKVDMVKDKSELLSFLKDTVDTDPYRKVMMISAKKGNGVENLEQEIQEYLPFFQPFYDEDQFTDRSERFLAAEMIREQLMLRLHQELPYALTVGIEQFKREPGLLRMAAVIWVERDSQKQIVIGKGGQALKQIGSRARQSLEALFEEKIYLQLWVKVSKGWSDNERLIERYGYKD